MFDHFGMAVHDVERSRAFYEAALAPLGLSCLASLDARATGDYPAHGFGAREALFWIYGADAVPDVGVHFAFRAATPAAVDAFHAAALAQGGTDNGAPGERPHYGAPYYAAFVRDPDGNNVEAVYRDPA
ncbi:MAG: VOC family protein [Pseudomonadota bacterium]